ncbi:hypothetical protein ACNKHU_17875 [Shigella flexneri]
MTNARNAGYAQESAAKSVLGETQRHYLEPLNGMGGASIFRVKEGDRNLGVIAETGPAWHLHRDGQNYLPAIKDGDKRVLVADGEPQSYCLARIPQGGETRGNLAAGGRGDLVR